jgi:hypothetical protein
MGGCGEAGKEGQKGCGKERTDGRETLDEGGVTGNQKSISRVTFRQVIHFGLGITFRIILLPRSPEVSAEKQP